MYAQYQVLTSAEATALWGLEDSTLRQAIRQGRLPAQKSAGTWLVLTTDMEQCYGPPQPEPSVLSGQTCLLGERAMTVLGFVPGNHSRYVLASTEGGVLVVGWTVLFPAGQPQAETPLSLEGGADPLAEASLGTTA